jgi:chromosome segregation ATPase
MYVALGFVAATLIALLIIPAINARAERLARRRVEALFPMSISELTAEKDHLRAEFAVERRRIERKAEEALAVKHQTLEELGRRAVRIEALETEVSERGGIIAGVQADLADARSRLAATEEELANTRASLAGTRDTLAAVEDAHRRTLDELGATRSELERTNTLLAGTKSELLLTIDKLTAREAELTDLNQRHMAALSDLDTKRITISDLETRLATQTGRGNDFERALGDRRAELAEERQRLADLAKNLLAEQERGLVLEQRIREIEAERDDKASEIAALALRLQEMDDDKAPLATSVEERDFLLEPAQQELTTVSSRAEAPEAKGGNSSETDASELRGLRDSVETLRAERAALEGALSAARQEHSRLQKEVKALRRHGGASTDEIRAENEDLRRRIAEVAEEVLRAARGGDDAAGDRRRAS